MAGDSAGFLRTRKLSRFVDPAVDGFLAQTGLTLEPEPGQLPTNQSGHRKMAGLAAAWAAPEHRIIHRVDR